MQSPVIEINHVSLQRDQHQILEDVSLTVNKGDFVAITGPNGGGKTTLLRIILGLARPSAGTVAVSPDATIGYLPQKNMIDSHFPITVTEVVASGLLATKGISRAERQQRIDEILDLIDLRGHARAAIGTLSGGQLQRTLFGRAIISRPSLLVLDEPLSYLDKQFEHRLYDIIAGLAQNATIVLVSHEMSEISAMANRHIIIDRTLHECSAAHHFVPTDCH